MKRKTYTYTNSDGTTQIAKVLRGSAGDRDYVVGDGPSATLFLPPDDFSARANLPTDADVIEAQAFEKLNRARFIRAAVELFDDEVKEAEAQRDRERDEAMALRLCNAFSSSNGNWTRFSEIPYPAGWLNAARAARRAVAAGE